MQNWLAILIAFLVSVIMFASGYVIAYLVKTTHQQWYEDAVMLQKVTNDIKEPGWEVKIRKIWNDDLHGMDHKSLIIAAESVKDPKIPHPQKRVSSGFSTSPKKTTISV